ncbi:butyrophilin subfamily 3 member A2-like isoform X2 [Osmerus mordax]|uniref:butyrophilin subfamily 3 member A2-like isoform X2 n=1 Tax=Osmerus mordax TaxID=8014 RepID=UPI003510A790
MVKPEFYKGMMLTLSGCVFRMLSSGMMLTLPDCVFRMLSSGMMLTLSGCVFRILLLLHTADCVTHKVITPVHHITAVAGESLVLPCYVDPSISAEGWTVEWLKLSADRYQRNVHLYKEGRDDNENQNPSFRTRTALFKEELKTGNTSLKLLWVRGTDEGTYKCFVGSPTLEWYDDSNIEVHVKAVGSQPVVSIEGHRGAGMVLVCETQGWYPEPEMVWWDSKGVPLSADPPETTRDSEGLYALRLRVTVQKTHRNLFNCRVKQKYMKREETARIHVPGELFYQDHSWIWSLAGVLAVVFGVSVVGLAVAICVLVKRHRDKGKRFKAQEGDLKKDNGRLIKDACKLTLDPNTAHRELSLSEENRKVMKREKQPYPDHPERFDYRPQVLCREGLSGRCYWEAEWSRGKVSIAVTYKGISRRGEGHDCKLGYNNKSWSLYCDDDSYSARHNKKSTDIPAPPSSSHRVGVYLDWPAGTLSFYTVSSDTLTHLHTFHSTFTEPLYPGFWVYDFDSSVSLCQIE